MTSGVVQNKILVLKILITDGQNCNTSICLTILVMQRGSNFQKLKQLGHLGCMGCRGKGGSTP